MLLPGQIKFKLEQSLNLNSTDRNQPLSTKAGVRLVDQQFFSIEQDNRPFSLLEGGVLVLDVEFEFKLERWSLNCLFSVLDSKVGCGGGERMNVVM
jgi:hypothetical protein